MYDHLEAIIGHRNVVSVGVEPIWLGREDHKLVIVILYQECTSQVILVRKTLPFGRGEDILACAIAATSPVKPGPLPPPSSTSS